MQGSSTGAGTQARCEHLGTVSACFVIGIFAKRRNYTHSCCHNCAVFGTMGGFTTAFVSEVFAPVVNQESYLVEMPCPF